MKNIFKILLTVGLGTILYSCDYQRINTNPFEMTDQEGLMDGVAVGAKVMYMERCVFPVGTFAESTDYVNAYQVAYLLSADSWAGFIAEDNSWMSAMNNTTYYLQDAWVKTTYQWSYTECLPSWKYIKDYAAKNNAPEYFALAQILKISSWHKALETFGPIPYKHAGEMALVIPFDSEQDVYNYMFEDLKNAIAVLTPLAETGTKVLPDFDAVYGGDTAKWVKYAKSLMLRLAIRLKYVAPDTARQWAMEAYGNDVNNLIANVSEEAQMSSGAGYTFKNNIQHCAASYGEAVMSTSMYTYLNGYQDPRLSVYFTENQYFGDKNDQTADWKLTAYDGRTYAPVPTGSDKPAGTFDGASMPNFTDKTPTYWMRASEVYFLLAEAALEWSEFGNASQWYEKGVSTSFEENGIETSLVSGYLNSGKRPSDISLRGAQFAYSASAPTTTTTRFNAGNKETALEQIITQKWLALFPNGAEAWTEWRRTGYPKLNPVLANKGGAQGINVRDGIRRMVYPTSFRQSESDRENYNKALELLGGQDLATTRLWWDKKY